MAGESTIGVIGAAGFLGRAVCRELAAGGWRVVGFSRGSPPQAVAGVAGWRPSAELALDGLDALVNLAGERIDRRWTQANLRLIRDSRVGFTRRVVEALAERPAPARPRVLVNASAVGIYGDRGDEVLSEVSTPGTGMLPELCRAWEAEALRAGEFGVRVVVGRIGVVFGRGGPAFERLRGVFASGLGGRLGSGRQWMPWIHVEDLARAIAALASDDRWRGPVNLTAPGALRNAELTAAFAAALGKPALLPVPALALKLALGGFGGALLASQRVRPAALEAGGFEFRHPALDGALVDLLRSPSR